jgi:hypothetical protein
MAWRAINSRPSPPGAVEAASKNSSEPAEQSSTTHSHPHQTCKWEGCRSNEVSLGDIHCQEHKRQNHQGGTPLPGKNQALSGSSSIPLEKPPNPTVARLKDRVTDSGSSSKPIFSGASPVKEKKQLSDKHTARKTVKQPSNVGQSIVSSPMSPARRPPIDVPSINPRPTKRQRLPDVVNIPEPRPILDSSSFCENGIPRPSTRGMFRQPEERTYKLSAVEDFALRPKKKEVASQSTRSKAHNDQRQLHRGGSRPSSSTHRTLPPIEKAQTIPFNRNVVSEHLVIDLTGDNGSDPRLPHHKQAPPKSHALNVIEGHRKHQMHPRLLPDPSLQRKDLVIPDDKQRLEGSSQVCGASRAWNERSLDQGSSNAQVQKSSQKLHSSAPVAQPTSNPAPGIPFESQLIGQAPCAPTSVDAPGPVRVDQASLAVSQDSLPPITKRQPANEICQFPVKKKSSVPMESQADALQTGQNMTNRLTDSTAPIAPILDKPIAPQHEATGSASLHLTSEKQLPFPNSGSGPVPPAPMAIRAPLSAHLGGREWKKMSPEERRLYWVSRHDSEQFDAQIYSENNRPFRPGDILFGKPYDELPLRPKRPATHFDYINPRHHYAQELPEEWHQQKQKEILARCNRKIGPGEATKRVPQRKPAAPKVDQNPRRDLPLRVRQNPQWLAAVDVMDQIAAQIREIDKRKILRQNGRKGKTRRTPNVGLDINADMDSSRQPSNDTNTRTSSRGT